MEFWFYNFSARMFALRVSVVRNLLSYTLIFKYTTGRSLFLLLSNCFSARLSLTASNSSFDCHWSLMNYKLKIALYSVLKKFDNKRWIVMSDDHTIFSKKFGINCCNWTTIFSVKRQYFCVVLWNVVIRHEYNLLTSWYLPLDLTENKVNL